MPSPDWVFADVAVDTPLDRQPRAGTFTYGIPSRLSGVLQPGHIVRVPFGRRQALGVVVAMRHRSPVERTRDVQGVVEGAPQLPPDVIATARWMSSHYMAPFIECLRSVLPPGALRRSEPRYRRTKSSPHAGSLTADERKVLGAFARSRELAVTTIRTRSSVGDAASLARALGALVDAGLLERRVGGTRSDAGARSTTMLRLTVDGADARHVRLAGLRPNAKADVIAYLSQPGTVLPTPEEVVTVTGCTDADVRALVKQELVELTPTDRIVESVVTADQAAEIMATELARAPSQARLLGSIAALDQPVAASSVLETTGTTAAVLDRLVDRNLVRAAVVPGTVVLNAPAGHARHAELKLRGLVRHAAICDYLAACGGVSSWTDVRRETDATKSQRDSLESVGLVVVSEDTVWRDPLAGRHHERYPAPELTSDQARAWETVAAMLEPEFRRRAAPDTASQSPSATSGAARPSQAKPSADTPVRPATRRLRACVVHGVTGSGKTELYLRAIAKVVGRGQQAIVLVPEIALTPQTVARFAGRFPRQVGVWHSELSDGERRDTWHRARRGELSIVVGSRSAVFAPLPNLGLIVIDEEHGDAYKQGSTPRYHARDVALHRAAVSRGLVLLGSATPSVETYFGARRGDYGLVELPRRIVVGEGGAVWGNLPPVEVVDMREELKAGNTSVFSRALQSGLRETMVSGEQAILLLNRRGSATFVSCRTCGHVQMCTACQVPLVWHGAGQALVCHHCNRREAPPMMCPACGSAKIRYFGAGTQRIEREITEMLPDARVLRWDADTTGRRGSHEAILAKFSGGGADVLVGTQMIAKGLDLPRVTLVGVVSADTALNLPDIWSRERTFQLLAQAAGRAGRSTRGGHVVLQTYAPQELSIARAAEHDYGGFYDGEIAFRQTFRYPPFAPLTRIERIAQPGRASAESDIGRLASRLEARIDRLGLASVDLIGPAPAFFRFERGRERWHLIIRGADSAELLHEEGFGPGWRVDVDPVSVL